MQRVISKYCYKNNTLYCGKNVCNIIGYWVDNEERKLLDIHIDSKSAG